MAFPDATKVYDIAISYGHNLSSFTVQYLCSNQKNFHVITTIFLLKASMAFHDM